MSSYILILVLIILVSFFLNVIWKVFANHGNIGFVNLEGKEVWVIKFNIPEDKIRRKKYILLKMSDVQNNQDEFLN